MQANTFADALQAQQAAATRRHVESAWKVASAVITYVADFGPPGAGKARIFPEASEDDQGNLTYKFALSEILPSPTEKDIRALQSQAALWRVFKSAISDITGGMAIEITAEVVTLSSPPKFPSLQCGFGAFAPNPPVSGGTTLVVNNTPEPRDRRSRERWSRERRSSQSHQATLRGSFNVRASTKIGGARAMDESHATDALTAAIRNLSPFGMVAHPTVAVLQRGATARRSPELATARRSPELATVREDAAAEEAAAAAEAADDDYEVVARAGEEA